MNKQFKSNIMKINEIIVSKFLLLLLMASVTLTSCENEGVEEDTQTEESISVDSELVIQMKSMVSPNSAVSNLICVDFVYPMTISTYDVNNQVISSTTVNSDLELNALFITLNNNQFVAIAYPVTIATTAFGNLTLSNDADLLSELRAAIGHCIENGSSVNGGGNNLPGGSGLLRFCADVNQMVTINLDDVFAFNLGPNDTVAYYSSEADAQLQINALSSTATLVLGGVYDVYVRTDEFSANLPAPGMTTTILLVAYGAIYCP
jgi:hypothetical protein